MKLLQRNIVKAKLESIFHELTSLDCFPLLFIISLVRSCHTQQSGVVSNKTYVNHILTKDMNEMGIV